MALAHDVSSLAGSPGGNPSPERRVRAPGIDMRRRDLRDHDLVASPVMSTQEPDEPVAQPLPEHGDVWYVSYGSNMSAGRLAMYLEGGTPPGGNRTNPGARNSALPRRSVPVDLPGALYFAGDSPQWGGGVAFYDHDAQEPGQGGPTAARAYLITAEQLADVAAQEMYRVPQEGDPLEEVVLGGIDGGRAPRRSRSLRDARGGGPARRRADAAVHLAPRDRPRRAHAAFRVVPQRRWRWA